MLKRRQRQHLSLPSGNSYDYILHPKQHMLPFNEIVTVKFQHSAFPVKVLLLSRPILFLFSVSDIPFR